MSSTTTQLSNEFEGSEILNKAIQLVGAGNGLPYKILSRQGRILCALPQDTRTALKTLSLYQPQKLKGQLFKQVIHATTKLGTPSPFLKHWEMKYEESQSIPGVTAGFIIGSRGHLCDRAVAVTMLDGHWRVVKMAFGDKAHGILGHEAMMMRKLRAHPYIPDMLNYEHSEYNAQLHTAWQNGKSWNSRDDSQIVDLLRSWQTNQRSRRLGDYAEWTHIHDELTKHEIWKKSVDQWAEWEFTPTIRHGDLTRPNLRQGESGELWVHDWERGSLSGLPGLDLAHYLLQDELYRGESPVKSLNQVISRMNRNPIQDWIKNIGWKKGTIPLLAVTIAYNTERHFIDDLKLMNGLAILCK